MKKLILYSIAVFSAASLILSCQKNQEEIKPVQEPNLQTLTVTFPSIDGADTKVSNDLGTIGWEVGDKLVFQGCPKPSGTAIAPIVHELTATEIVDPKTAVINIDLSSLSPDEGTPYEINVAYPAEAWSSYSSSHTYGRSRFTDATNQLLLAGYLNGSSIELEHVTAVLFFKVPAGLDGLVDSYTFSGKNGEVLGYGKYLVEINSSSPSYLAKLGAETYGTLDPVTSLSGPVVADGTTVHAIYFQNEIDLADGFTLLFKLGGVPKKTISASAQLHLVHGHGVNLGLLPEAYIGDYKAPATHDSSIPTTGATALDESGNANSYIVDGSDSDNEGKVFTFKAYKGNSTTGVGVVDSVELLWETWNTSETVTANSIIADVDFEKTAANDYYTIVFKTSASLHPGNAVIAAKDAGNTILWSWHIWVPDGMHTNITEATIFGDKAIMSRNLGALVDAPADAAATVESYGLLYQWGRKDPFPGMKAVASDGAAAVAGTSMTSYNGTMTIAETIQNPTKYAWNSSDWCDAADQSKTLWTTSKTIYDPCPPGYIVPTRNTSLHFWGSDSLGALDAADNFVDNGGSYYSFQIGVTTPVVFPFAGYVDNDSGSYYKSGKRTAIWSSYCSTLGKAYARDARHDSNTFNRSELKTSRAASVRCVVE